MIDLYRIWIKRIISNKFTKLILLTIFLISVFLTFVLAENAQTKSSIPIGILNMDDSTGGRELVYRIKQMKAFYVYEGTQESLNTLLKEDRIQAVFIVKEGYEKSIKSGKTNKLVTLRYKENNEAVKILSDIFAGEMLKNICLYKGYLLYESAILNDKEKVRGNNISYDALEQYAAYVEKLGSDTESFSFDIRILNNGSKSDIVNTLDNALLYIQILSGILTMFLSFFGLYTALPLVMDMEDGIRKRITLSGQKRRSMFSLDLCAAGAGFSLLLCFNLIICLCFFFALPSLTLINTALLFILFLLYSVIVIWGFIIAGILAGKVRTYERVGIVIAFMSGLLGIGSTFAGLFNNDLLNISKFAPNSWFISGFIDIIVNTGLQDIPYMQFFSLGITGFSLFCILWLLDKVKPN